MSFGMISGTQPKLLPMSCLNLGITENDLNYWSAHLNYFYLNPFKVFKLFEEIMYCRLDNDVLENNFQFGSQSTHSTKHTFMHLMNWLS